MISIETVPVSVTEDLAERVGKFVLSAGKLLSLLAAL
jgi:hypothetical protein